MKKFIKLACLGLVGLTLAGCSGTGAVNYESAMADAKTYDAAKVIGKAVSFKGTLNVVDRTENKDEEIKAFLLDLQYKDEFRYNLLVKSSTVVTFQDTFEVAYAPSDKYTIEDNTAYAFYFSPTYVDLIHSYAGANGCEEVYTKTDGYSMALDFSKRNQKTSTEKYTYAMAKEIKLTYDKEGLFKEALNTTAYVITKKDNNKDVEDYKFVIEAHYEVLW